MQIFYVILLCLSAWLISFCLMRVGDRLVKLLGLALPVVGGMLALSVTLGFMVVVAAPAWVILLSLVATMFMVWQRKDFLSEKLATNILAAGLLAMVVMGIATGPSWLIVDALIIGSALGGIVTATRTLPEFGRSAVGFGALIAGLFLEAAMREVLYAS